MTNYDYVAFCNSFFVNLHGLHMVNTRSSNKKKQEETMATVSNEIKCYFKELIERLELQKSLEDLFSKLKDDLLKRFDEKSLGKLLKLKSSIP